MNTTPRRSRRALFLLPALASLLAGGEASAASIFNQATDLLTPSFRGNANTTYFGWQSGSWDGNADGVAPDLPISDTINGTPSSSQLAVGASPKRSPLTTVC